MPVFLEKRHFKRAFCATKDLIMTSYGWVQQRLWPIYSAAILICVFQMLATAAEKQTLADHLYGANAKKLEETKADVVSEGKKYFNEEVSLAIKEKVWQLPERIFKREYAERHGN